MPNELAACRPAVDQNLNHAPTTMACDARNDVFGAQYRSSRQATWNWVFPSVMFFTMQKLVKSLSLPDG
jgi:hypothetical protein